LSTCLLDLDDRIITDTGSMVAKYNLIIKLALDNKEFEHLPTEPHEDIYKYYQHKNALGDSKKWEDNGIVVGPSISSYEWNIPDTYKSIDIIDYCQKIMISKGLTDEQYIDRLSLELVAAEEKGMEDFIRALIYIVDVLRDNKKVWGLGRGSSCASLIMFIIGVNKGDPVLYNIDMGEFYK